MSLEAIIPDNNNKKSPLVIVSSPYSHLGYLPDIMDLEKNSSLIFVNFTGYDGKWEIQNLAADIENFRKEKIGKKINMLGHCFGGTVIQKYAAMYPESVDKIILANTSAGRPRISKDIMIKMALFGITAMFKKDQKEYFLENYFSRFKNIYLKEQKEEHIAKINLSYDDSDAGFIRRMQTVLKKDKSLDLDAEKINCYTLIICSEYDALVPKEEILRTKKAIKNSKLAIVYAGHFSFIEKPHEFNEAVGNFLGEK